MGWDQIMLGALPLALAALLLSAGLEDVRTREIADWKNAGAALLAPAWWWANGLAFWPDMAVQIGVAVVVLGLFGAAFHLGQMGGGDVKLIAALALWFPFGGFAQLLAVMSILGGAVTLAMLIQHRITRRPIEVPYGVAIAAAGLLSLREPILNQIA